MLKKIDIAKSDDPLNVGFAFIDENGDAMEEARDEYWDIDEIESCFEIE